MTFQEEIEVLSLAENVSINSANDGVFVEFLITRLLT